MVSIDSFSGLIHGFSLGLNTVGNPVAPRQHFVECMHFSGSQLIVSAYFLYCFMVLYFLNLTPLNIIKKQLRFMELFLNNIIKRN